MPDCPAKPPPIKKITKMHQFPGNPTLSCPYSYLAIFNVKSLYLLQEFSDMSIQVRKLSNMFINYLALDLRSTIFKLYYFIKFKV